MAHTHDTYDDEDEYQDCPHCDGWPCICDSAYELWADK